MTGSAADEPPIDTSRNHYMEERALAVASAKAATQEDRAMVEHLAGARAELMRHREVFLQEAVAKRHARGEVYSAARVAALNGMGPSLAEMDGDVRTLYARQPDARSVLATHARTHFGYGLASARLLLASHTPDIAEAAREMQEREEAFAAEWTRAVGDAALEAELRESRREAFRLLRTSTRPMVFVTEPPHGFHDDDAQVLGKAWNKLDELAGTLGVEPLSRWIALPDEDGAAVPAGELLPTVEALAKALQVPATKFPAKRATLEVLTAIRAELRLLDKDGGRACFEVDT